jgi:tRNA threonylcarbamoyladenosine biosynthesis protein TsaE
VAAPVVLTVGSPAETAAVAEVVAGLVRGGDLVVLTGGVGAGKTAFTKAFASALGVTSPVTSPTFTLANRYEGDLTVHHLDAYRLDGPADVIDLGLDELIGPDSVTVIEWGDTIAPALPGDRLEIALALPDLESGHDDEHRVIVLAALGREWARRLEGATFAEKLRSLAPSC